MIHNKRLSVNLWPKSGAQYLYLLIVLILAVAIRLVDLPGKSLWYDELQSVTFSSLSVQELIRTLHTFDTHPPLYYIQLHFWLLLGNSDWWIKLNSVVWSVLTLVMIFLLSKDLFNSKLALVASLVFAVSPLAVFYAQEARMYSLLMFLGVGSFYFFRRFVENQNWLYLIGALLFTEGFLYSHGAGFMILVSLCAYVVVLVLLESRFRRWRVALKVGLAFLVMVILYIPELRAASSIFVGVTLKPNLNDVVSTLFILLGGVYNHPTWVEWIVIPLIMVGVLACLLRNRGGRVVVLAFIIAPMVFCFVVSYLIRPIWLYRTLAYIVPFLSIAIAFIVVQIIPSLMRGRVGQPWVKSGLIFATTLVLLFSTILQQTTFSYPWHIRDAARFIQSVAQKGDVVYVPNVRIFWGMGWYFIGPGSVDPLTTNYSLVSPSGIKLISKPALPIVPDNANYWLVSRSYDDLAPFVIKPSDPVWDFADMQVIRVSK
jgi:uncharacterized membrane protein